MHAADHVDTALLALDVDRRRVADGEWGLTLEAAGWPLHVGLALTPDGTVLRVQGEVAPPGQLDPHDLLYRNRRQTLVAFTHTGDGTVWVEGWVPVVAADAAYLDRVLGALVAAAEDARANVSWE